ncbi:MAG: hypothetical protein JG777_912 [Clostridia bacterium]|jgi:hypothetical protein|nr:hypothetical protein [Clostridia bacterium]
MSVPVTDYPRKDSTILFFILVFLLLFYDNSPLYRYPSVVGQVEVKRDSSILFFILIFLLLFYDNGYYAT